MKIASLETALYRIELPVPLSEFHARHDNSF